jgi:bacterioferritin-associated ferredoxin
VALRYERRFVGLTVPLAARDHGGGHGVRNDTIRAAVRFDGARSARIRNRLSRREAARTVRRLGAGSDCTPALLEFRAVLVAALLAWAALALFFIDAF